MANEVAITVSAKDLATGILKQVTRTMEAESRRWEAAAKSVESYNKAMRGVALAAVASASAVAAASVKMAMNAVESENLFKVSMGKMSESARKWSEDMRKSLGVNAYEVRKSVGVLNTMLGSMGLAETQAFDMSKALTKLSYDMASFYNISQSEAFEKIQAGISGETEPLKRLGVLVNETTIKNWALTHGLIKQGQTLSETGKVMARYGVIVDSTKNAQGDLARTLDSPTNKLRIFGERIRNVGTDIGASLIPAFSGALNAAEPLIKKLENMAQSGELERWGKAAAESVQKAVDQVLKLVDTVVKNKDTLIGVAKGFVAAWAFTETIGFIANITSQVKLLTRALNAMATSEGFVALGSVAGMVAVGGAILLNAPKFVAGYADKKIQQAYDAYNKRVNGAMSPRYAAMEDYYKNHLVSVPGVPSGWKSGANNQPLPLPGSFAAAAAQKAGESAASIIKAMESAIVAATRKRQRIGSSFDLNAEKHSILTGAQDRLDSIGAYTVADSLQKRVKAVSPVSTPKFQPDSSDMTAFMEAQKKAEEYHKSVIEGYQKMGNDWRKAQVEKKKAEEEYHQSVIDGYKRMGDQWRKEQAEKRKADAEKAKLLAEELAAARKQAAQTLTGMVTNRLSVVGGVIQGAQAGQKLGAAFGPEGAVIGAAGGALVGLITQSKTFEKLLAIINPILESVANAFGQVLEPLLPIAQTVSTIVSPIIKTFGNILKTAIEPAMPILFNIIKYLGLGLLGLGIGVINVKNSIIGAAQGILRGIGNFLAWLGLGLQDEGYRMIAAADKMEGLKASTDELQTAFDKLKDMTYDKAKADSAAAAATESLMRNVPELFKVALVRNSVAKGIPGFATGGYVPATPGGTIVRVGEGGEGEYIVPKSKMGGVVIHVDARGSISPDEVERRAERGVMAAIQRMQMAKYGTAVGVV